MKNLVDKYFKIKTEGELFDNNNKNNNNNLETLR